MQVMDEYGDRIMAGDSLRCEMLDGMQRVTHILPGPDDEIVYVIVSSIGGKVRTMVVRDGIAIDGVARVSLH